MADGFPLNKWPIYRDKEVATYKMAFAKSLDHLISLGKTVVQMTELVECVVLMPRK